MDSVQAGSEQALVLAVSDPGELSSLERWLTNAGARVQRTAGTPGQGELGVTDVLEVLAGSSGLVAAIKVLPEWLRARRSGLEVSTILKGRPIKVTATNVEDVMPILERLLDERDED